MPAEIVETVQNIILLLQLVICVGSVVTLFVTIQKAVARPNQTQNDRLSALEEWKKTVDTRLKSGEEHFSSIDDGNRITQASLLALMSHAINGNDIENLKRARDELQDYLVKK